jgi:hypothetical protein
MKNKVVPSGSSSIEAPVKAPKKIFVRQETSKLPEYKFIQLKYRQSIQELHPFHPEPLRGNFCSHLMYKRTIERMFKYLLNRPPSHNELNHYMRGYITCLTQDQSIRLENYIELALKRTQEYKDMKKKPLKRQIKTIIVSFTNWLKT